MKYDTWIKCFYMIVLTVTILPCLASSLREIAFFSNLFKEKRGNVERLFIPAKIFNGVLERRVNKINELKERNNLTSEELVLCDFARHSLELMQVSLNSSYRSELILVKSTLVNYYVDIVNTFHSAFGSKRAPSVDYEPVVEPEKHQETVGVELLCICNPIDENFRRKTDYPKSKMLMLIDAYKSDINLLINYKSAQKLNFHGFIESLETLKWQISNATELDNDLSKESLKTMRIARLRFEFIVKMFLNRFENS